MDNKKTLETFIPIMLPAGLLILGLVMAAESLVALVTLVVIAVLLVAGARQTVK